MHAAPRATGEIPQQPAVDRAGDRVSTFGVGPNPLDLPQNPSQIAAGEVRGRRQPSAVANNVTSAVGIEIVDKRRSPRVLPDDGVVVRAAGAPIPHDRRLALIGDTKRDEVAGVEPVPAQNGLRDRGGALPDLDRVVLDPPGPRQDLLMLELVLSDLVPVVVEHHESAAGRALVYGGDEVPHLTSLTGRTAGTYGG